MSTKNTKWGNGKPYVVEQRNFTAYDTVADAENSLAFKGPGTFVYIISEDEFYYWKNDLDGFVKLDTNTGGGGAAADVTYSNVVSGLAATNVQDAIDEEDARIDDLEKNDPNILYVNKNPKTGEFSSIAAALATIVGASSTNPFCVHVGPGVFVEPEIVVPSYVSIVGCANEATIVKPDGAHHIFRLPNPIVELSFMTLANALAGSAGVFVDDCGDWAQCYKLSFFDCDINVLVKSVTQDTFFYGEYIDCNGDYSYGTKVVATGGFTAFANLENYHNLPTGPTASIGTYVGGVGSSVSTLASTNDGVGIGTAFYIENGAHLATGSTHSNNWNIGLHVGNVGIAPSIASPVFNTHDNITYDLFIEHPGTTGTLHGVLRSAFSSINALSLVSVVYQDPDEGDFTIFGKLNLRFPGGTVTDVSTLLVENATMGVVEGGVLSDGGGFVVNITSGFGYLEQLPDNDIIRKITWGATSIVLTANVDKYIYFNNLGTLTSSSAKPDTRYTVRLGRVVTNSTGIEFIDASPSNAEHTSNLLSNFVKRALGPVYESGSIVVESATPFHLDIGSGSYYFAENNYSPSGQTDAVFTAIYGQGTGVIPAQTVVSNTQYDAAGVLTALTADYYAKHSLYLVGEGANEKYYLVYAQSQYATLLEAQQADIPSIPSYFKDSVVLIAGIIVQQGAASITQVRDLRPTIGFKSEGVNASADHGSLLGLGDDDHPQYLLIDGTRAMTGSLDLGANNLLDVGSINGISPSVWYKEGGNAFGANAIIGLTDAYSLGIRTNNIDRISIASGGGVTISDLAGTGTRITLASATGLLSALATANTSALVTSSTGVPSWTSGTTANRVLRTDGTTVSFAQVVLTTDVSGILPLANGGTNASLTASNGAIVYSTATAFALSAVGSSGQVLQSNGAAAPTWSTATYPSASGTAGKILRSDGTNNVYSTSTFADTYAINNLLYANAANTIIGLATANDGVLITSGTGVPSISSTLPNAVQDNITRLGTVTVGTISNTVTATFKDTLFTLQDDGDTTKQLQFQLSEIATATIRTLTVPNYNGTIVARDRVFKDTVTTTNATTTTITTISTSSNKGYLVETRITSRRTAGTGSGTNGDVNGYIRYATIRNVGGTLTIVGTRSEYTDEDIASHNVTITTSGTNILIQVAGSTNNTVDWVAITETIEI